jgi:hypothetical protein
MERLHPAVSFVALNFIIMKSKTNKTLKWIPSILVALMISLSACMKLASNHQLVEIYTRIGLLSGMMTFGVAELLFTGLFLFNRTMKIGLLLLTGYYGGAMAVELSHGGFFIVPAVILTIVWIGAFLRNPSLFLFVDQRATITQIK